MNGDHGISFFHSLHFKTKHYFKYTDVFKNLKLNFKPIESDPNESNINITFNVETITIISKRLHHHQIFNYVLLIHPKIPISNFHKYKDYSSNCHHHHHNNNNNKQNLLRRQNLVPKWNQNEIFVQEDMLNVKLN